MLNQRIEWALQRAENEIHQAVQESKDGTTWNPILDEDHNPNVPADERQVLVFMCGDRSRDDKRPEDAAYGLAIGWFDHDRKRWYVHGSPCRYVTHWRECPPDPPREKAGES